MKKRYEPKYADIFKNFMDVHGDRFEEHYHQDGQKGPCIIGYEPVREAMIRVETADGRRYDYSDKDPYALRCVDRESANRFDDEFCREEFAEKLRTIMLEENVTARELADLTGIIPSRIEKLWKGDVAPRITEVMRIATALEKYPGDLLDCM